MLGLKYFAPHGPRRKPFPVRAPIVRQGLDTVVTVRMRRWWFLL